ncbi:MULTISPECIES: F0F1 ATP synthase subunit A [Streptosporangium]|uniref:ATP synthase subunit a n=1 Tax=Streptosporangium brasiliense TaxID=47480 RepID=A0ABT9RM14_9ACTN|nr:F0F1 ATP synthase subunit A [Streptosporangium brasiliense]MDP9869764.1 F-type H+-transporting ATPase subunit a [Streptosporangium brasiliense]
MRPSDDFQAPGLDLFHFPPLWPGAPYWLTKPILMAGVGIILICALLWAAFARPALVPRGLQNIAEMGYLFVREHAARPFLGKDADRWMGLLLSIFLLTWIWNLMGVIPLVQLPVTSFLAFPAVMALTVYVIKIYVGVRKWGAGAYVSNLIPRGLPKLAYVLLIPLELLQNFVTSLFTHMLRLAANMFAGHLLLAFFSAVGFWFLFERPTPLGVPVGVLGVVMAIVMTGFEMFIQFLQAYLFVLLTAMFIGDSLDPEH